MDKDQGLSDDDLREELEESGLDPDKANKVINWLSNPVPTEVSDIGLRIARAFMKWEMPEEKDLNLLRLYLHDPFEEEKKN